MSAAPRALCGNMEAKQWHGRERKLLEFSPSLHISSVCALSFSASGHKVSILSVSMLMKALSTLGG